MAAFTVKFAAFCQWPRSVAPGTNHPFVIGVVGGDRFVNCVRFEASGWRGGAYPLEIRYALRYNELVNCHILCVTREFESKWDRISEAIRDRPVLLVTDIPRKLQSGAVVEFVLIKPTLPQATLRFAVDLDEAIRRQLQLSPELLRAALEVVQNGKRSPVSRIKAGDSGNSSVTTSPAPDDASHAKE